MQRFVAFVLRSALVAGALNVVGAVGVGCSEDAATETPRPSTSADSGIDGSGPVKTCPTGFRPSTDGIDCDPILPPSECAAGTMGILGESVCQRVGTTSCAAGFAKASSGWGCAGTIPRSCSGALMERLGDGECQPVGDCAAPFPPAGATLFVDPNGAEDATHTKTIAAAIALAADGDTIAVGAGTYVENLVPTKPVQLVGKCAAEVTVQGDGMAPGILADGVAGVSASGMTFRGHFNAIYAKAGGSIALRESVVEEALATGVRAAGAGTQVTLSQVVVRRSQAGGAGVPGWGVDIASGAKAQISDSVVASNLELGILADSGEVTVTHSIVRDTKRGGKEAGSAVALQGTGTLTLDRSLVTDNVQLALRVLSSKATLRVKDSVVRDTQVEADQGVALKVEAGDAEISNSTLSGASGAAIQVQNGSHASLTDSVISETTITDPDATAALQVVDKSTVEIARTALIENERIGLLVLREAEVTLKSSLVVGGKTSKQQPTALAMYAKEQGRLTLEHTTVRGHHVGALFVVAARADVKASIIRDTEMSEDTQRGGYGLAGGRGAQVTVEGSYFAKNHTTAIQLDGPMTVLSLKDSSLDETAPGLGDRMFGGGLVATGDTSAQIRNTQMRRNFTIGMAFGGASAVVDACLLRGNPVGLGAQDGSTLVEMTTSPTAVTKGQVIVSGVFFSDTASRISATKIPLPAASF